MWPLGHVGFTSPQTLYLFFFTQRCGCQTADRRTFARSQSNKWLLSCEPVTWLMTPIQLLIWLPGWSEVDVIRAYFFFFKYTKKKKKKNHWQSLTPWGAWSSWHLDLALTTGGPNALFFLYWSPPPPPPPRRKQSHMLRYCVPCDRKAYTYSHRNCFFIPFPSGLQYSLGLKTNQKNPTGSKNTTTTPPTAPPLQY